MAIQKTNNIKNILKEPNHRVDELIRALSAPKLGWYYQGVKSKENFYGGEGFNVLESNQPIDELKKEEKSKGISLFQ